MRSYVPVLALSLPLISLLGANCLAADPAPFAGDAERGKTLFLQNCALCHSTGLPGTPLTGQGPLLAGIMGRPAASVHSFGYTKALQASGITWDAVTVDRFLAGPGAMLPGTMMVAVVPKPADRGDLIAFLATLRPLPLRAEPPATAQARRMPTPGDWQNDAPGKHHQIRLEDLPAPYATVSAGNAPHTSDRPAGAALSVPPGFTVTLFASGLAGPRLLRTAPNGDIFIAETRTGQIRVLRAMDGADSPSVNAVFARHLNGPFGLAFYPLGAHPRWIYVGNLNSVVRIPYRNGDLQARGPAEVVVPRLAESTGGHTTRNVAFSLDGRRLFISVGSGSNVAEGMPTKSPAEIHVWEAAYARGAA